MKRLKDFKLYKKLRTIIALLVCVLLSNCVEEFDFETEEFESILVVNTTITNEVKRQKVVLSKTFRFEENAISEQGAVVKIIDDTNTEYLFEETFPGLYLSLDEFGIVSGKQYHLSIQTQNGRSYISDRVMLPQETPIERVYPTRMVENGVEGLGILVDTFDPTNTSRYYRYEFEETYRITAPFWVPFDINTDFTLRPRPESERVCYGRSNSNSIIATNTVSLDEDRLTGFVLEFIPSDDIRVAERYSVLVRQFVQSRAASDFYEILNSFSESENLFSQIQPGFVEGNIISENNPNEKVLGFFDVSSVTEKRIFFNNEDLLEDLPKFSFGCRRIEPMRDSSELIEDFFARLMQTIASGIFRYLDNGGDNSEAGFSLVRRECGDCTAIGNSAIPDFWVEE